MQTPMTTSKDIPLLITSTASSSERRITPSWTITQLKSKLEPITGIPPSSQRLTLRLPDQASEIPIEASDEDTVQIGTYRLVAYAEIKVTSTSPHTVIPTAADPSIPKSEMPISTYEALPNTVLFYKRAHGIGRFDPNAPEKEEAKVRAMWEDVEARALTPSSRCHLSNEPLRRGTIRTVSPIGSLPGPTGAPWIGIELDEPFGKNNGTTPAGEKVFSCKPNYGVFVRPERVVVGDFGVLGLDEGEEDEDLEEL